jgi:glycosyltransferase involved in cell wall biosynthesis
VSKTVVAPLGLRESLRQEFLKEPSASVASSDGKLRVLTVARLHPRKGQLEVARALGLLAERWRDQLIYQVCGRGDAAYAREVEETLRAAGVTVEMRGEVSSAELRDLYARCDVLAQASVTLPTSVEGFGLSYLEAGAYGKPVVGYRSGGTVDAVVDEGTGLLVAEGDTVALAQALERLLEDESLRRRMGGAGREWALRFSYDHSAQVLVGEKM